MDDRWEWFCGDVNATFASTPNISAWIDDVCFIDGLTLLPHSLFIVVVVPTLLLLRCFLGRNWTPTGHYSGHSIRWLVGILSLIFLAESIGEGVLTDATRLQDATTHPHYYLPGVIAFNAFLMSLVYYDQMERLHRPGMSVLLLCYWPLALTGEGLRLAHLKQQQLIDFQLVRVNLTLIMLIAYGTLFIIELKFFGEKVCRQGYRRNTSYALRNPNMHFTDSSAHFLSRVTFSWVNWLFAMGYKKPLKLEDLGEIPERYQAHHSHRCFKEAFQRELTRKMRTNSPPSLWRVYIEVYGPAVLKAALFKIMENILSIISPLCIGAITAYAVTVNDIDDDVQEELHYATLDEFFADGFVLAVTSFIILTVKFCFHKMTFHIASLESSRMMSALQSTIYQKALRLSPFAATRDQMNMGQIVNLMSTDAGNIRAIIFSIHNFWSAPLMIIVILTLLYHQMGVSALLGAVMLLVSFPIHAKISAVLATQQKAALKRADQRLKHINELLQGIKLVKMNAWEQMFCKKVEVIRKQELVTVLKIYMCEIAFATISMCSPIAVTLVTFSLYSPLSGKALTPEITFTSLALLFLLVIPLFTFPGGMSDLVSSIVSTRRLQKFLQTPEVQGYSARTENEDEDQLSGNAFGWRDCLAGDGTRSSAVLEVDEQNEPPADKMEMQDLPLRTGSNLPCKTDPNIAVKITNGNFVWDPDSCLPVLSNVNLEIPAGKLTMVIGQVGSGKSSLLAAILGEMTQVSGSVHINNANNRISFAAQIPWILNISLKDNILFFNKMEKIRYQNVLEACCLGPDIGILPAGDETEIGEKGINLSGGQKQRVSIARAIYSDRDIVILDDPLSALDVHVGRRLFEEGIMKLLVNANKTVILVTNQLQYLNRADLVLQVQDGQIVPVNSPDDVIAHAFDTTSKHKESKLRLKNSSATDKSEEENGKLVAAVGSDSTQAINVEAMQRDAGTNGTNIVKTTELDVESTCSDELLPLAEDEIHRKLESIPLQMKENSAGCAQLVEEEEMAHGSVSYKHYLYLVKNMGWTLAGVTLFIMVMQTICGMSRDFWLSKWSEAGISNKSDRSQATYLHGYIGLSFLTAVCQLLGQIALMLCFLMSARHLHQNMLRNIVRAPMRFFDTNLTGRILNRFANDTSVIDLRLGDTVDKWVLTLMQSMSAFIVVVIVLPFFLIFSLPIILTLFFLQRYYLASSRELQRIENTNKSPVLASFAETLGGLSTIRAYRCEEHFYDHILALIDRSTTGFLYLTLASRWLELRLEILGTLFYFLATTSTLIGVYVLGIDASLVGLSATYALQLSAYLGYLVKSWSETEQNMNSVERIQYYTDVDTEDYQGIKPVDSWPQQGDIKISNISVRYAEGLDPVLRDVTVDIKGGEKIGICGRTGSGKTSLTLSMLRFVDIFKGGIFIDGVDIKSVPLSVLRSRISIIPQDPLLFTGSVRYNLDPELQLQDAELWTALEKAQLKEVVSQLEGALDSSISDGGENFSVGQRQLFCLARAFLRKTQILIMDEPTASVDMETDKILQGVVAKAFAQRTVLTIAHRLATIQNSDKILVLEDGRVAEFGRPEELMKDKDGMFTALIKH